jgi:antitoxin component YwqK of YwqJK toxin-antitoxin module
MPHTRVTPARRIPPPAPPNDPEARCARLEAALACPAGTARGRELAILSEEGSRFCLAWCARSDGTRDGPIVHANVSSGRSHVEGHLVAGKRDGEWRTWNRTCLPGEICRDRVLVSLEHYRADRLHGMAERRHPDGRTAERGAWIDGERDGVHEQWNVDGVLVSRGSYARGTHLGTHETWWSADQLASRTSYDAHGRLDGEQCQWTRSGAPLPCSRIHAGTGTTREYEDDVLVAEIELRDGVPHGVERRWDLQELIAEIHHRDGKPHGRTRKWRHGCLELDATYRDGTLHGPYTEIECDDRTGKPTRWTTGRNCAGAPCGTWTERTADGSYRRVYRHGASGEVVAETVWLDGRISESWDAAKLRAAEHALCLRELKRGGCCDPEQRPPPGARLCENGRRR